MELEKKPPDPPDSKDPLEKVFMTIKCPLKCVLKNYDVIQPIIEKAVIDINEIVILSYQFIRLYLLDKFNNNQLLPIINKQFVLDVMKTISSPNTKSGQKVKEENIKNATGKIDIKQFYKEVFYDLVSSNNKTYKKPSYTNKTFILEQTAKEMITCIETNISTHFIKHLFKYINCLFKYPRTIEIKKEKNKEKRKEMYKELNQEIRNLKNDIINNKIDCSNEKYHTWINENKKYLYPLKINKSVAYDVKIKPERYIQYSFYLNKKIEELGRKTFQTIPQRNNIVPKNILLNSPAIIDIIDDKKQKIFQYNKTEILHNSKKYQPHIWSKILKMEKRSIFNHKDYIFYNQMTTDGFSCNLLFILKKYKNKEYCDNIPKNPDEENIIKNINTLTKDECNKYLTDKYKLVSLDLNKIIINYNFI